MPSNEALKQTVKSAISRASTEAARLSNPRSEMVELAMHFAAASSVHGDYYEFGVYQGDTFASAFQSARRFKVDDMRFHAFDSFNGLPPLTDVDAEGYAQFSEGEYNASRQTFEKTLKQRHVDRERVTVTEGWFSETLTDQTRTDLNLTKAAVIWVDCDLYESTVPVLDFIKPLLQDGTVVAFDDWFCFHARPDRGEQRAVTEWLQSEPDFRLVEYRNFGWHGKAFVFHRA